MHLKKKGTVLISTVIILSLMSLLGCLMFKMMKNNNESGAIYKFDKDIYDLDKDEEEILYKFMEELNRNRADELNNQSEENNSEEDTIFSKDFIKKIEDSILEYNKNNDKIFLITVKDKDTNRKREIKYIYRNKKIILIPTYKFEDDLNKNS